MARKAVGAKVQASKLPPRDPGSGPSQASPDGSWQPHAQRSAPPPHTVWERPQHSALRWRRGRRTRWCRRSQGSKAGELTNPPAWGPKQRRSNSGSRGVGMDGGVGMGGPALPPGGAGGWRGALATSFTGKQPVAVDGRAGAWARSLPPVIHLLPSPPLDVMQFH